MKGFLKELQESNATGAVQVVRTLSGSVKQPELDGYADKEIFSVHGKGKLLWAEVSEVFTNLPSQSGTQMKIQLYIDGKLQANIKETITEAVRICICRWHRRRALSGLGIMAICLPELQAWDLIRT